MSRRSNTGNPSGYNLRKRGILEDIAPNTRRPPHSKKQAIEVIPPHEEQPLHLHETRSKSLAPPAAVLPESPMTGVQLFKDCSSEAESPEVECDSDSVSSIADIDDCDREDPLCMTEYVDDIYDFLRQSEKQFRPIHYMDYHSEINEQMRGILVNWLIEVSEESTFKLTTQTLFLVVAYMDLYLSKKMVPKKRLQLVGLTCLHIAAKYEMIYPPRIDRLVYICENTYSAVDICSMEQYILQVLDYQLTVPTAKEFLNRYLKAADADELLSCLASFLIESTLCGYHFISYLPSMIAAAATALALYELGRNVWTPTLSYYTGYSIEDPEFQNCVNELYEFHQHILSPKSSIRAVVLKWTRRKAELRQVPVPDYPPFL